MKKIEVKNSLINGSGLFATQDIKKDVRISYIAGKQAIKLPKTVEEALSIPNWFGLSRMFWIDPEGTPFQYLNHSCEPNAAIVGRKTLVAMRNIKKGEEITIDYSMTDADPIWFMDCDCKSKVCRKKITSIHSVPTKIFEQHMPYIPKYFQRVYFRHYVQSHLKKDLKIKNEKK